ncbi:MAG: tetratricopeptide repeat protein [Okeania sp. SIO2D1]|nr:tetratricopeptide repeat protein [Okeania sp. SIO2D1]
MSEIQAGANSVFQRAIRLQREGKLDEAIALFREAIEKNPSFSWTYFLLGELLVKQDRLTEAAIAFKSAIKLNENFHSAHKSLADYCGKKIDVVERKHYDSVLKNNWYHIENLEKIIAKSGKKLEGNCFYLKGKLVKGLINKQINIYSLAKVSDKILEIGFNGGHSALIMLLSNPNAKIVAFDICSHKYVVPCFEYLLKNFSSRIELVKGDSMKSLPEYIIKFPNQKFDLLHIDGGHKAIVANTDFENCLKLSFYGSYIIWDDVRAKHLNDLWHKYISEGYVREVQGLLPTNIARHAVGQCLKPS